MKKKYMLQLFLLLLLFQRFFLRTLRPFFDKTILQSLFCILRTCFAHKIPCFGHRTDWKQKILSMFNTSRPPSYLDNKRIFSPPRATCLTGGNSNTEQEHVWPHITCVMYYLHDAMPGKKMKIQIATSSFWTDAGHQRTRGFDGWSRKRTNI